jgi:type IV pilus assembly protein PilV
MFVSRSGFTLVEFLVAIVILMVGLLGMLQAVNVAMDRNFENILRSEAVTLADDRMMLKRAKTFSSLSTTVANPAAIAVPQAIRGIMKNYSVQEIVSQPTSNSKQVVVTVSWRKKDARYTHSISSVVSTF